MLTHTGSEAVIQRSCVWAISSVRIGLNLYNFIGMAGCSAQHFSANFQGHAWSHLLTQTGPVLCFLLILLV